MINVEVERNNNENNVNVLRRFTRKVQGSGILNRVRGIRYNERAKSPYVRKKKTLKRLERRKEVDHLIKMGKMQDKAHEKR